VTIIEDLARQFVHQSLVRENLRAWNAVREVLWSGRLAPQHGR
jgi:hypothetical protein